MTDRPTFRYPRSGPLIARLLQLLGHGPKSWPAPWRLSASTLKRIADDEPTAQSIDDFLDVALGLLVAPGTWKLGGFGGLDRGEVIARLRDGLRAYDRAVSELNAGADLAIADPRHALPVLVLVAVRVGAFFGVFAAARQKPLEVLWPATLDPGAFCLAITDYAERAMPATSWRDRGEACGVGRNTLDRWRRRRPGPDFKCSSLKKFAEWAGERIAGEDPAMIEWRLRWLVAGSRIHAMLERFLGRDPAGLAWVERIYRTIQVHAGVNAAVFTGMGGIEAVIAMLDSVALATLSPDVLMVHRRMFAFIIGRASHFDPTGGPDRSLTELETLRGVMLADETARRHVWTYFGGLHALGLWAPGFLEDVAARGVTLEQYLVHLKDPAQYLRVQHFLVTAILSSDDADRNLALELHMPLTNVEVAALAEQHERGLRELVADPRQFGGHLAVYGRLRALQRELAGLPRVDLPPIDPDVVPADLREFAGAIDLQRGLAVVVANQDEAEAMALVEQAMRDHPELIDPPLIILRQLSDANLKQVERCCATAAKITGLLDVLDRAEGSWRHRLYREVLPMRRELRGLAARMYAIGDEIAAKFAELAARAGDGWTVRLACQVFLTRRAAVTLMSRRLSRPNTADRVPLRAATAALAELHAARPDHPEPCLWLARAHATLGDRSSALRWARLAEQRGEPGGLAAVAALDEDLARTRATARTSTASAGVSDGSICARPIAASAPPLRGLRLPRRR